MKTYSPLFLLAALACCPAPAQPRLPPTPSNWKCKTCPYPKGHHGPRRSRPGTVSEDSKKFGDFTGLNEKGASWCWAARCACAAQAATTPTCRPATWAWTAAAWACNSGHAGLYSLHLGYSELPRHFADGAMHALPGRRRLVC
jgi:hypothetical protein